MFIDSHSLDEDSERRLRRYGTVYKIGIDDFAGKIKDIKTHTPSCVRTGRKDIHRFFIQISL